MGEGDMACWQAFLSLQTRGGMEVTGLSSLLVVGP